MIKTSDSAPRPERGPRAAAPTLRLRREAAELRDQLGKLAALVDHYYGAYRETARLLERRDRELAELRGKVQLRPTLLASAGRIEII